MRVGVATPGEDVADMTATQANDIVVAILALAGVIVTAAVSLFLGLRRVGKENRDQHRGVETVLGEAVGKLDAVHTEIRDLRKDFTRHLEEHDRWRPAGAKPRSSTSPPATSAPEPTPAADPAAPTRRRPHAP